MATDSTYRSSAGQVHSSGSLLFNNTFGQETVSFTSSHGNDLTFAGQAASWFNPNNLQVKTNGDSFCETQGYRSTYTGRDHYMTTGGNLTITTGAPNLFDKDDTTITEYLEIQGELAAAHVSPNVQLGGVANNTGAEFPRTGTVNTTTGSTQGQSYPPNPAKAGYSDLVMSKVDKLTQLESKMGAGGDLIFASGKDVLLTAGTKSVSIDSGLINPVGKEVARGYKLKGSSVQKTPGAAPTYQEKDTFSHIPFGSVNIMGANRFNVKTGAGGIDMQCSGSIKFAGTGLSWFSGSQVNIVANQGSVYIDGVFIQAQADTFNVESPESTFNGNVSVTKDALVVGDLVVGGNLRVLGNIVCDKNITAEGDITAGGKGGISLLTHVHSGIQRGNSNTLIPV